MIPPSPVVVTVPAGLADPPVETITFSYRTIAVNWLKPSKPFKEDWMSK